MVVWRELTVGDLCETISETYQRDDEEVILVNTSDVLDGKILKHQSAENKNLKGQFKKTFKKNDILYSEIRPVNKRYAYIDFSDTEKYIASTKLMVLRPKTEFVLPRFLFLYLSSRHVLMELQHLAESRSGTFPQITFSSEVAPLHIFVPDFDTQEKIIEILDNIERKINNNKKINDNLADLLQTIYQERFGDVSMAIDQGILSDICSYSRDRVAVSELDINSYFSTENMLSGKAGATEATSLPTTQQTTACHKGDTLISNIRPYFKKIVYCETGCGCSTDVLCFTPVQSQYAAYLFSTLYADKFFSFMIAGSKGTKMPRGDKQQIMTYPVALPSDEELEEFNTLAMPILAQICSNRRENKGLSAMRDALLPKLMSGELDVSTLDI